MPSRRSPFSGDCRTATTVQLARRRHPHAQPRAKSGHRAHLDGGAGPPSRGVAQWRRFAPAHQPLRLTRPRFSSRRSSSVRPPQTPASWPDSRADSRQSARTGHRPQTRFAASTCSSEGPVVPIGKNSSGSSSRQAAARNRAFAPHPHLRFAAAHRSLLHELLKVRPRRAATCDRLRPASHQPRQALTAADRLDARGSPTRNDQRFMT